MDTRLLSGTTLRVSRVCMGAMTFGGQTDEPTAARMVDTLIDRGVNFFDTANVYTGGKSEEILGRVLGARRKDVVIASKVANAVGTEQPFGLKRELILKAVDDSLRRLGTDYIDLYYLHLPDWNTPIEESLEAMDSLVKSGKVRFLANSNYAAWQMTQMLWIAEKKGYQPMKVAQPMYNLIARRIEDEYLAFSKEYAISNIVYNPLAGGLLSGKHNPAAPVEGSRFDGNKMYLDRYWKQQNHDAVVRLSEVAQKAGRTMVSLALNWLWHHTPIDCILLGASKYEHLNMNLDALNDGPLTEDTLTACDEVWNTLKGVGAKYNR